MKKHIILVSLFLLFILPCSAKAKGYGVGPHKANQRPNCEDKLITKNNGICIGPDDKSVYLTFDCGYENGYTEKILDTLEQTNTKAIFFITGHYLNSRPDLVKRMKNEGHLVGNHTYSHKDFTKSTSEEILSDIHRLEDAYFSVFGEKMVNYVRPPRGEYDAKSQKLLNDNGYVSVFWSLAYMDWDKNAYHGNHYSYQKVMQKIHNGAIILMHTVGKDNSEDLYDIITKLQNDGYTFKSIENIIKNN